MKGGLFTVKPSLIYRPLTALPFRHCASYQESDPCQPLRPYIRCFWGGETHPSEPPSPPGIVIPDTCVDIIYQIDNTDSTVTAQFHGVNDRSYYTPGSEGAGHETWVFAIRFYAWSAYLFSEDSLAGTVNSSCDVGERFRWLDKELLHRLLAPGTLADKIRFTEQLLLKKLETARANRTVDSVINHILSHCGTWEVSRLAKESFLSPRQMERLFHEYIGITPKKLSNLVRYQFLWNDIVGQSRFDILNAVSRYGYTDSAHLMREFKRYHSMNIHTARQLAFGQADVGNIQDISGEIL